METNYIINSFLICVFFANVPTKKGRREYFANHTSLKLEEDNLTNIAPYAFDLYELSDVPNLLSDSRFLIDIVRIIEDRTMSVVRSKEDEKKSYMKFRITDGRTGLNVTFFITLAEDLEKELKNLKEETVTIFIASAKVNEHEGTPCLNNYPATRFYLNIDHYSVKKMKERLLDPTFCAKEIELEGENIVPILTVAEIKKIANRIHSEINDPAEMLGSHSLGTGEATPMNEKSVSMQVDAPDMTKTSPPTAKSSNKVRSREKNENVAYELEDNPPLGKFKVVKFEKV